MDFRNTSGIIIPAYNAERYLAATLQPLFSRVSVSRIVVVDDGSWDATRDVAESLGVKCLRHEENQGKGAALMTGLQWAAQQGWEWAVTMDADGQHAPKDLEKFWKTDVGPGTALVVGRRGMIGSRMPWHRRFSNAMTTWMISLMAGKPVYDAQCGFRMYRLSTLAVTGYPSEGRFEWEAQALVLCGRSGFSIQPVDIETVYTDNGSHMRLALDTLRFLKMYWRLAWMR